VDLVVGTTFSNVLMAIVKPVTDANKILISPNAGPSPLAGKACHKNFFSIAYQNDQVHEVLGAYAQKQGFKKVALLAPNYQAGKDSLAGFKRSYKGEVVTELYSQLGQVDFSAELAQIAAASPDALFTFMPGGMGVNLVKQYRQAGLATLPFLSAFTVDESTLPAQKEAALGFFGGATWAPNMDNAQSKAFVAAYEKKYNSVPGVYAMQGYDAARLIDSAVKSVGGKVGDLDGMRKALEKADFQSLRGSFKFGANHFPVQDFYLVKVAPRPDGKFQTEIDAKIFTAYADSYAGECSMK
jgi:branched-chain amino acid transport system substrate-binding protein